MKLGLLTATCLESDLDVISKQAAEIGYDCLELAAWPAELNPSSTDETIFAPSRAAYDETYANEVLEVIHDYGLEVSALAYYPNNLHPEDHVRRENHEHLKVVIRAAAAMDIDLVGTFIGRDPTMPLDEAIEDAKTVWPELLEFAESHDVRIMIENCPMDHHGAYGTNLFYNPQTWEELFTAFESDHLGLNYDPSHLYWLGIDHIAQVEQFADRIFHAHAKDTAIYQDRLNELGVLSDRQITEDHWWEYRIPGLGEIDWSEYIRSLYDIGFEGTLSVEHEDPQFNDSPDKFWKGAEIAHKELQTYV